MPQQKRLMVLVSIVLAVAAGSASGEGFGVIDGRVYDVRTDEPVAGANVVIENTELGAAAASCGRYEITRVPAGEVDVTASAVGFRSLTRRVRVDAEGTLTQGFGLEPEPVEMAPVDVTAPPAERLLGDKPATTHVITRSEIESRGAGSLQEALRCESGVRATTRCPMSNTVAIELQGLAGRYTGLALDGMPGMTELSGSYGMSYVPADAIERVEISRGPGAFEYGSGAFGGVVNVVSRDVSRTGGSVTAEAGELGLLGLSALVGARLERLEALAILNKRKVDAADINGDGISDYPRMERSAFSLKLRQQLGARTALVLTGQAWTDERQGGSLNRVAGRSREGTYENPNLAQWGPTAMFEWRPDSSARLRARGSYTNYRQRVFSDDDWFTAFEDVLYGDVTWTQALPLNQRLSAMVSHRHEHAVENTRIGTRARHNTGVVLEDEVRIGWLTVAGRGRYDRHSAFGSRVMPGLAVMARPAAAWTVRAGFGSGFKAPPAFSKLTHFCPGEGLAEVEQNPDLQPERSLGGNASVEYRRADVSFVVSAFRTDVHDMVAESLVGRDTVTRVWRYRQYNRGAVVSQGCELTAAVRPVRPLLVRAGYALLDARDGDTNEPLPYRSRHSANWQAVYDLPRFWLRFSLGGELVGPMPTERREAGRLVPGPLSPAYTRWDGRVTLTFGKSYSVFLAASNLFDYVQKDWLEGSVPLWGPNRGRQVSAGVKLSF